MIEGKSCQRPGRIGSRKSHAGTCGSRDGGPTPFASTGTVVVFVVFWASFTPGSISLNQFESVWGTAERDNDVWQPVDSPLRAFACLGGNAASLR